VDDDELVTAEVDADRLAGGGAMVDLTVPDIGRSPDGVDPDRIRPGVLGEVGSEKTWVSPVEERVLRAVARAHRATGVGIGALHAIEPRRRRPLRDDAQCA
jgi:predicted metal-dependent phosphotriesterase family hydrolase